ncbi:MAG: vitamin K epoxide reductase family protein [Myxococcales bacterium]|nr:vitamin K epoxide reductase family protein [Myxococcales bacterium]
MLRPALAALSIASAAAMIYVGAYQTRQIDRLECPAFGHGCEAVADAPFARPFGLPDGYLGAGLYVGVLVSLTRTSRRARGITFAFTIAVAVSNAVGVLDMARFGAWCFWCLVTTVMAVPLLVGGLRWFRDAEPAR